MVILRRTLLALTLILIPVSTLAMRCILPNNVVSVRCLAPLNNYLLKPMVFSNADFDHMFEGGYKTPFNGQKASENEDIIAKLKKQGIFLSLTKSKHREYTNLVPQQHICELNDATIKTELIVHPSPIASGTVNSGRSGTDVKIWLDDILVLETNMVPENYHPQISAIEVDVKGNEFHLNIYQNNIDNLMKREFEFFKIIMSKNKEWREEANGKIFVHGWACKADANNLHDDKRRKFQLPIQEHLLNQIDHLCIDMSNFNNDKIRQEATQKFEAAFPR